MEFYTGIERHGAVQEGDKQNEALRWYEIIYAVYLQLRAYIPALIVSVLGGVCIQFLLALAACVAVRRKLAYSYYFDTHWKASVVSCAILYALARTSPPLWVSAVIPLLFGAGYAFVLAYVERRRIEYNDLHSNDIRKKELTLNERFVHEKKKLGWRHVDIAAALDVSEKTVQRIARSNEKKLNMKYTGRGSP